MSVLGLFHGVIDILSLTEVMTRAEMMKRYTSGATFIARVVFVDHQSKALRLSLRPHVLSMTMSQLPELGEVLEDLSVMFIMKHTGLLLAPSKADPSEDDPEESVNQIDFHCDRHLILIRMIWRLRQLLESMCTSPRSLWKQRTVFILLRKTSVWSPSLT